MIIFVLPAQAGAWPERMFRCSRPRATIAVQDPALAFVPVRHAVAPHAGWWHNSSILQHK